LRNYAIDDTVRDVTNASSQPEAAVAAPLRDLRHYRLHAEICKVLTDPKRLMLLDALRVGERSVGDLAEAIDIALPNASQHLAVLRRAGLVDGRRSGTSVLYRLAEPAIVEACDVIDAIVGRRTSQSHRSSR
jgi:DNA-binding transcriptional ArsR family regulator